MWRDDGNLCFLQVKGLSVEQPGEHFLPLTCSWGGAGAGRRGLWKGGFALLLVQLGGVQLPTSSPRAGRLAVSVPHSLLHGLECWAQGDGKQPLVLLQCGFWLAGSDVPGCALSAQCNVLERS